MSAEEVFLEDQEEAEHAHLVMFSSGLSSWMCAVRVKEKYGIENMHLLFTDVLMEDPDNYRFLEEVSKDLGVEVTTITEGRNPWQVFFDNRYMGGPGKKMGDPCSRILKREAMRKYIDANFDPRHSTVYIGMSWDEPHRHEAPRRNWLPWRVEYPLAEEPHLFHEDLVDAAHKRGIEPPSLYKHKFAHANCGGFCIKGGHGHFARLYKAMPERYLFHEEMEEAFRKHVGKDVAILRDRRNGTVKPLTLRKLRERFENPETTDQVDMFDMGACGCFSGQEEDPE